MMVLMELITPGFGLGVVLSSRLVRYLYLYPRSSALGRCLSVRYSVVNLIALICCSCSSSRDMPYVSIVLGSI